MRSDIEKEVDTVIGVPSYPVQGSVNKNFLFGGSHWTNGTFLLSDMVRIIFHLATESTRPEAQLFEQCKAMARRIKAARMITPDPAQLDNTPPKEICDQLIDAYMRNFEGIFRILHIPTFMDEYCMYWRNPPTEKTAFVIQLHLVMAIGAGFYDRKFSLKATACQWINEAELWLVCPNEKSRLLNIPGVQVMLLLQPARWVAGLNSDLTWISSGAMLRMAMSIGLHRDPTHVIKMRRAPSPLPKITFLQIELRRRLWATVLELTVMSSFVAGGPPLISLDDFDTLPPGNFDDEDLVDDDSRPTPKPITTFTQSTIQIAATRTFPARLAIAKFSNDLHPASDYQETLRLDFELSAALRTQTTFLQPFMASQISTSQVHLLDLIMHNYYFALHVPFLGLAKSNPTYYYSRKKALDTALKLYHDGRDLAISTTPRRDNADYACLFVTGSGPFRNVHIQCHIVIATEMDTRYEDRGSSYISPSEKLLEDELCSAIRDWNLLAEERIRAGHTSVKNYICATCVRGKIDAMCAGKNRKEMAEDMLAAVYPALVNCHGWLSELEMALTPREPDPDVMAMDIMNSMPPPEVSMPLDFDWNALVSCFASGGHTILTKYL